MSLQSTSKAPAGSADAQPNDAHAAVPASRRQRQPARADRHRRRLQATGGSRSPWAGSTSACATAVMLGPFWLTLSTAVMVAALGFSTPSCSRWSCTTTSVPGALAGALEGAVAGDRRRLHLLHLVRRHDPLHADAVLGPRHARVVVRNMIVLAHNVVVIMAVYAWFDVWPGWAALGALPALLVWIVDGLAVCLLLGPWARASAISRRSSPASSRSPSSSARSSGSRNCCMGRPDLLWLNPFYTLLEIVRGPHAGRGAGAARLGLGTRLQRAARGSLRWFVFARTRGRLAFWV